ncbi:uncharacterized protein LOC130747392 isoform X2 [Lotus japonicus]|nr:uncharacterized protein LOC130747392 isoform X2 [Lotus japonicus]
MKAQSEIGAGSLGRTRGSKNRNEAPARTVRAAKRSRKNAVKDAAAEEVVVGDAMSEEEAKSDVVDLPSDEVEEEELKGDVVVETVINEEVMEEIAPESVVVKVDFEESEKGGVDDQPLVVKEEKGALDEKPLVVKEDLQDQGKGALDEQQPLVVKEEKGALDEKGASGVAPEALVKDDKGDVKGGKKKKKKMALDNTMRRFTRSALKQNSDEMKMEIGGEQANAAGVGIDDNVKKEVQASPLMTTPMPFTGSRLRKFPTRLKDLLATGILEGLPVKYIKGVKARRPGENGLRGVVTGPGILCYCDSCNGTEVVSPTVYELHAGSANKRPPEYTYLDNGRPLRDVMNACSNGPLGSMEEVVQMILGQFTLKKSNICFNCRVSTSDDGASLSKLFCDSCMELKDSQHSLPETAVASSCTLETAAENSCAPETAVASSFPPPTDVASSCPPQTPVASSESISPDVQPRSPETAVLTKSLKAGMKHSTSRGKSQGKLTRKDLRLHKFVFEEDVLAEGVELAYYAHGKKLLVGYKKGCGILCTCCNAEVSASLFESHAGWATRRKPYHNIYTTDGVSLHDLSISLSRDRRFATTENDDLCSICEDGGDLLCCDGCPRAFHIDCVPLSCIPSGTWYCKYCQNLFEKDKPRERNNKPKTNRRCVRVVRTVAVEHGGCALCGSHDFSKIFGPRTVIICDQCEREYHVGCLKQHNMQDLAELPEGNWFCRESCNQIHSALINLVACGEKNIPDSFQSLIKKKHEEKGLDTGVDLDIKWRVLNWKLAPGEETRPLLSKAVAIFHERFDPIVDSSSGRDFIPTMLYGRNIRGQDFGGMYCAVLTVNQVVVSAGVFRVFGPEIAELPLVATTAEYQGQGYFQCLFSCIEGLLGSLNVKNLVLPAAEEAESIWTGKFGFTKLGQDEIKNYKKFYHMMVFQGTSLLQKPVSAL